jgi:Zn finger protein HypA/HybF involved in hydrogenase expression
MGLSAFCTTCQRNVYVEEGDTSVCPVCSSPLLETIEAQEDREEAGAGE